MNNTTNYESYLELEYKHMKKMMTNAEFVVACRKQLNKSARVTEQVNAKLFGTFGEEILVVCVPVGKKGDTYKVQISDGIDLFATVTLS
jgi:hypothetical protein